MRGYGSGLLPAVVAGDTRGMRRRVCKALACWLVAAVAVLMVCVDGAFAATGHEFLAGISEGSLGSPLLEPAPLAISRGSGYVFVGDRLSGYVDVYRASGEYVTQLGEGRLDPAGIAVDESNGDVYVADPPAEAVLVYEPDGAGGYRLLARWFGRALPGKEYGVVAGVAVDNSEGPSRGEVYVLESRSVEGRGAVDVYSPEPNPANGEDKEGEFVGRLSGVKLERPNAIAVSPITGRIVVGDSHKGAVYAFNGEGLYEEKWNGKESPNGPFGKNEAHGNVTAVAVDESSGDVYVAEAERHAVSQYSSEGVWEGWITGAATGELSDPQGVGVASSGDVYVADAGLALVNLFGPDTVVPNVTTGKVATSSLTPTSALLAGAIDGDGKAAKYHFEYGATAALGSATSTQASGTTGEANASAEISRLMAGAAYYYRIVGENEDGTNAGAIRVFETLPAVEDLATGPVKNVVPEGVTLTGTLNPGGLDAHYYFQWGASSAYGNTTPAAPGTDAGSGTSTVEAETVLSGLTPNGTYHYRLVGENSYGRTYGQDRTFTTSGPPRICIEPTSAFGQEEAMIHACVNPDLLATVYRFEYGETTGYGREAPVGGESIGSGSSSVAVTASLAGLKVGTTYHFRVVATNEAGTTIGPDQTFTTVPSAPVDAMFTTKVSDNKAVLHARINPLGSDTHYYFQYGTQGCRANPAGCIDIPAAPGEGIGSGTEDAAGEVTVTGLQPGTTYHYRLIASNALGVTEGPERTFTTQTEAGSFTLPDNRAWELVSPPDKEGAPIESLPHENGLILAANDGDALTYVVNGGLGEEVEGNRSPEWQQVLATRTPSGWSSKDIATPNSKAKGVTAGGAAEYQFFSPQLSVSLVEPAELGSKAEPPLAPGVTQATIYLRDNETGSYLPVVNEANTSAGTQFGERAHFLSASSDLSHVVLESEVGLTGPTSPHPPGPYELYEWSNGQLQLVSLLPGGKVASHGELGFFDRVLAHAISSDGSRVIWTNKEDLTMLGGHLYMRDTVKGETIKLDAARSVAEPETGSAQFQTASSDGSRVFFTDKQPLTSDATPEPSQGAGRPDLYECVIEEVAGRLKCNLNDLTVDTHTNQHADVQNFIFGASEDGSSVYLVAQGVLANNQNGNGETAVNGRDNLYELRYDGSKWSTLFIATLSEEDNPEWEGEHLADTAYLTARVSPNGRYLAFMSAAPITGYDNVDANHEANGARDEEVFLYDSATASLRCVSCNPSGARPAGVLDQNRSGEGLGLVVDRRRVWLNRWIAGNIPGWTAQTVSSGLFQSRYLSDDGRLYFNSPDSLVPAATNGKEDVYQYEPSGVGSCQSPSGGCVSLISGGSSDRESAFIEATPDGSNVFFVTEAQLLPSQDTDTAFDIYDARECTELSPCLIPPESPPPGCGETKTCRPAEPAQLIPSGPAGTATTSGPGNVVPQAQQPKQQVEARRASRPLTRAQKLKRALKRCRKHHAHAKKKRRACEHNARKRYGRQASNKHKVKHGRKGKTGSQGRTVR